MPDFDPKDNLPAGYEPAKVWEWDTESGGKFANINRPIALRQMVRKLQSCSKNF